MSHETTLCNGSGPPWVNDRIRPQQTSPHGGTEKCSFAGHVGWCWTNIRIAKNVGWKFQTV